MRVLFLIVSICICASCNRNTAPFYEESPTLSTISIIDRNGFSETISNPERIQQYENVDFLCNQPYQKVMRIYSRDLNGDIRAYITSYHPNGQPKQYLEVVNNRALGQYQEWYENGILKISVNVIGGNADIDPASQKTWLFDGCSRAWDETGNLMAELPYSNGVLEGLSLYYHPNGQVWKKIPMHQNEMEGCCEIFCDNGMLLQTTLYLKNKKHGTAIRYWNDVQLAAEETYQNGQLIQAKYYMSSGELISSICEGDGYRAAFAKECVCELQQYRQGVLEGEVKVFGENGSIAKIYHVKNDMKHGEETEFYESNSPKLSIQWIEGQISGLAKTWYPSGIQESQREMSQNKKNGILTAWYPDGSIMLIEKYQNDQLMEGQYFSKNDQIPTSEVHNGKGIATLFDVNGNLLRRVQYQDSKPSAKG